MKMKRIREEMYLPLLISVMCNTFTYYISRLWTTEQIHFNLSICLDKFIPYIPWTVSIYFGSYLFWAVNYFLGCEQERNTAYRFMSADFIAKIVCFMCFTFIPTTNIRPEVSGNQIWDAIMTLLYRIDPADNLFPSIHCISSCFSVIAVRENSKIPVWYKGVSVVVAICIYISTLTTKQHVVVDVIFGIALAEGCYLFVKKSGFSKWYEHQISQINRKVRTRRTSE